MLDHKKELIVLTPKFLFQLGQYRSERAEEPTKSTAEPMEILNHLKLNSLIVNVIYFAVNP